MRRTNPIPSPANGLRAALARAAASTRASFMLLCLLAAAAQAQGVSGGGRNTTPPGLAPGAPAGSYALSGFESVNLYSGNVNLTLPLLKVGGRGRVGVSLNLSIDSARWDTHFVPRTGDNYEPQPPRPGGVDATDYGIFQNRTRQVCTTVTVTVIGAEDGSGSGSTNQCETVWDYSDSVPMPGAEVFGAIRFASRARVSGYAFFPMARSQRSAGDLMVGYGPGVVRNHYADGGESVLYLRDTYIVRIRTLYRMTFAGPDGTEHQLVDALNDGRPVEHHVDETVQRGRIFASTDGSQLTFVSDVARTDERGGPDPTGYLLFPDGTRSRVEAGLIKWTRDADGNAVTYTYGDDIADKTTWRRVTEIKDTLGRRVTITYGDLYPASAAYDEIKYSGVGGTLDRSIKVWYSRMEYALRDGQTLKSVGELFPRTFRVDPTGEPSKYDPVVTSAVELPDGRKYQIKYNSYGEIARVELPTGAAVEYDYTDTVFTPRGILRRVKERRASADGENWEQVQTFTPKFVVGARNNSVMGWETQVTVETRDKKGGGDKLVSREKHHFYGHPMLSTSPQVFYAPWREGREFKTEQLALSAGDNPAVLRRTEVEWRQRETPAWWGTYPRSLFETNVNNAPARDPRVVTTTTSVEPYEGGANLVSKQTSVDPSDPTGKTVGFDRFNNRTDVWEYDFGAGGQAGPLLRRTHTDFVQTLNVGGSTYDYACSPDDTCGQTVDAAGAVHLNGDPEDFIHIRGLPSATEVTDAAGTVVFRSEFLYDEPERIGDAYTLPADFPGWAAPPTPARGHLTTARAWLDTLGGHEEPSAYLETHTQYDRFGNAVKAWDARGNISEVKFSATYKYSLPTQTISADPDGPGPLSPLTTSAAYDFATGVLTDAFDVNDQQTHFDYESEAGTLGRLKKVTPPAGAGQTEYEYVDTAGDLQLKVKKQVSEDVWDEGVTFYDNLGRTTKTQTHDSVGDAFSETVYDGSGRIRQTCSPYRAGESKHWVETSYDELGRVKEVTSPKVADEATPAKLTSEYAAAASGDQLGLVHVGINQAVKRARSITNALGQLVRVDEPNEAGDIGPIDNPTRPTFYTYDTLGNLIKVEQGDQTRFFLYDSLGRLIRVRQPEQDANPDLALSDPLTGNGEWSAGLTYDENGNVRTATDAKGVTLTYEYDSLGRLIKRSYAVPQTTEPERATLPTSEVTFKYDGLLSPAPGDPTPTPVPFSAGKLTEVSNGVSSTQHTDFDNLGRVKSSRQIVDGQVYPFGYKYNLAGEVYEEVYPSGRVITNAFDDLGDLSSVSSHAADQAAKVYVSDFKYTADGAVEQLKLGNQKWETYKYNAREQVTRIGLGNSPADTSLWRVDYEYGRLNPDGTVDVTKNDGNLIRQTITVPGAAHPFMQSYGYDPLNRLTEAVETAGDQQTWRQTFGYDRYGNRTEFSQAVGETSLARDSVNHPEVDPLTNRFKTGQGYEYDFNGNLIRDAEGRRFGFDGDNRQGVVKDADNNVVATYGYDGSGRRVKKSVAATGEVTVFVYDAAGKLAAEYSNVLPPNPATRYVTADILNTPRVITGVAGEVLSRKDYMPFGEDLLAGRGVDQKYGYVSGVRQGFTGFEKDEETRLSFAEARYYNPHHGRFTAVDPLLASGRSLNPQTYNRYAYAGNNPTLRTDPNGEVWKETVRDVLVGYTRHTERSYQWNKGGREVRSHIVFTNDGPTRGLVVLDRWENRFKEVASVKEGQAQFEAWRRQAALNYLAGVAESLSLVVELSGALDGLNIERNSEQFKLGQKSGTSISMAAIVMGGGGAGNFLLKQLGKHGLPLIKGARVAVAGFRIGNSTFKEMAVIGKAGASVMHAGREGVEVFIARGKYYAKDNWKWVDSVIERRMPVELASPISNNTLFDEYGRLSAFGQEVRRLEAAGYYQWGNFMLPPRR